VEKPAVEPQPTLAASFAAGDPTNLPSLCKPLFGPERRLLRSAECERICLAHRTRRSAYSLGLESKHLHRSQLAEIRRNTLRSNLDTIE
jgi:hypothetical protein